MSEGGAILIALYGALLGARHALEPDHLAAVSTMAAHGRSRADVLRISAAWGAGHASLIAFAGILATLLGWEIPQRLAGHADEVVGLALIVVGGWTLAGVRRERIHVHLHAHEGEPPHVHVHIHPRRADHEMHPEPPTWLRTPRTAFAVGTLHGMAGSGAAVALAVLAAPSRTAATLYLLSFALGSLVGMLGIGAFAFWPIIRASSGALRARQLVRGVAGMTSLVIGVLLATNRL